MARYGTQFGPATTLLGVPLCDWSDPATYAGAQVVVLGGPFDGGTSHRPGTLGPQYIRQSPYLPNDGSRPSLALRGDGLPDAAGVAQHVGRGRVSMIHFDAHADTGDIEFGSLVAPGSRCAGSSSPARCAATGSCRSGCAATGPGPTPWRGWSSRACAPTR